MGLFNKLKGDPLEKLRKEELATDSVEQEREEKIILDEIERLEEQRKKFLEKSSSATREGEKRTFEMQTQQLEKKININKRHLEEIRDHLRIIENLIFICDSKNTPEIKDLMIKLTKLPRNKTDDFLGKVNLKKQPIAQSIKQLSDNEANFGFKEFLLGILRPDIMSGGGGILEKIGILLRMTRPQGMISAICACFAGVYLASMGIPSLISISTAFLLIALLWFGGILLNDFCDYESDLITEPNRLIPLGKISRNEILYGSIFFMFISLLFSIIVSIRLTIVTSILIIMAILYNLFFKRMGFIGSFTYGIIVGLSFLIGVFTVGNLNLTFIFLIISVILMHTTVNMIGAIKDIDGDIETGTWTVPAKYGMNITAYLAILLLLASFIMAYIPVRLNLLNFRYIPILIAIIVWLVIVTIMVKNESKLGYMALGMYELGASIYYISFSTGN